VLGSAARPATGAAGVRSVAKWFGLAGLGFAAYRQKKNAALMPRPAIAATLSIARAASLCKPLVHMVI